MVSGPRLILDEESHVSQTGCGQNAIRIVKQFISSFLEEFVHGEVHQSDNRSFFVDDGQAEAAMHEQLGVCESP
jgi:hypothetical protein